jgi:hypothetical protein
MLIDKSQTGFVVQTLHPEYGPKRDRLRGEEKALQRASGLDSAADVGESRIIARGGDQHGVLQRIARDEEDEALDCTPGRRREADPEGVTLGGPESRDVDGHAQLQFSGAGG